MGGQALGHFVRPDPPFQGKREEVMRKQKRTILPWPKTGQPSSQPAREAAERRFRIWD